MRPYRVVIGGLPYFGRMLVELLQQPGWELRYLQSAAGRPSAWLATAGAIAGADLVYLVGGQVERRSRPDWLTRVTGCPIVMHWVGSDVTFALTAARRRRTSSRLISRPVHWAEVPWTAAELETVGICATVVPLTSTRLPPELAPLPEQFTVLAYLPDARREFYGSETVLALAAALPEVRFLVAGGTGAGLRAPSNVEFLGWVDDMTSLYARSSVLLRLPQHDGLSFMVLEALAAGRHVIWNHEFGAVMPARDEGEAQAQLEHLLGLRKRGTLGPNLAGRRMVEECYPPERIRSEILERFDRILTGRRT